MESNVLTKDESEKFKSRKMRGIEPKGWESLISDIGKHAGRGFQKNVWEAFASKEKDERDDSSKARATAIGAMAANLLGIDRVIRSDEIEKIRKLASAAKIVTKEFEKLYELGMSFEMAICGGAVRDVLLGRSIKDMDVVISFDERGTRSRLKSMNAFGKGVEDSEDLTEFFLTEAKKAAGRIGKSIDGRLGAKVEEFDGSGDSKKTARLLGVVKIGKGEGLDFGCDLLFTKKKIVQYAYGFDFGICQAFVPICSLWTIAKFEDVFDFYDSCCFSINFLKDAFDEKLRLNVDRVGGVDEAEHAMGSHYERLEKKFPEYELEIETGGNAQYEIWKAKILLNKGLSKKSAEPSLKKPKI